MNKENKSFDAVLMMREIRDRISQETQNMSFEELKAYINKKLAEPSTDLGKASWTTIESYLTSRETITVS